MKRKRKNSLSSLIRSFLFRQHGQILLLFIMKKELRIAEVTPMQRNKPNNRSSSKCRNISGTLVVQRVTLVEESF
jgi:hypothetical protein